MRITPFATLACAALAVIPLRAQESGDIVPVETETEVTAATEEPTLTSQSRGKRLDGDDQSLFSDAEIGDLYRKATAVNQRIQPKRVNPIRNESAEPEGPIVELDPMTVRGDAADTERIVARVKREMERRPESIQRRIAELSPGLANRAMDDARANNRIFDEEPRIGPSGVPSTGGFTAGEVSHAVSEALRALFAKED